MLKAPQQKRSEETLQRILFVCEALIDQGRFEQVSMQEIASEAGVSVGTLYKRFSAKSAIVDYLVERLQTQQYEQFIIELAGCEAEQLADRLRYLTDLFYRSTSDYSGLLRTVMISHLLGSSPISDTTTARSAGLIGEAAQWLDQSDYSPGVDACQKAVAHVAFAFQYRAIYPTPDALLGADVYKNLVCEMALKYLGV
ncbi:MAG: TetR/AcrR family transcriptional regulator [Pseudomonadaceae bacterium]|nr:TetR/AcrR family transcriptional regulator [Pseudomonadaceae bacterium]